MIRVYPSRDKRRRVNRPLLNQQQSRRAGMAERRASPSRGGDQDDGPLDSIGKPIVAPAEGADEEADTTRDRPFTELTKTLPQGEQAADYPTLEPRRPRAH
jgi:hypothetical protein